MKLVHSVILGEKFILLILFSCPSEELNMQIIIFVYYCVKRKKRKTDLTEPTRGFNYMSELTAPGTTHLFVWGTHIHIGFVRQHLSRMTIAIKVDRKLPMLCDILCTIQTSKCAILQEHLCSV
jgi:hypothetical protein